MKIRKREIGDVVVLDVNGNILGQPDGELFQETIRSLIATGTRKVLVNLGNVGWINSTGLGTLIAGFTEMQKGGGTLKLVAVSPRIQSVLAVTRLTTIFEAFQEEEEAVRSFT